MTSRGERAQNGAHSKRQARRVEVGSRVVLTHGLRHAAWRDPYHLFMTVRWPAFFALMALSFLLLNVAFAGLYLLQPGSIANQAPAGFWGAFFFSVETLGTIGYGDMHPQTSFAHTVATVEAFVGIVSIALMTGLMFARFSRPRALVLFSQYPVIAQFEGYPTLMFRAANVRQNVISEATAKLRLLRFERTPEGSAMRRIHDLPLLRSEQPVFQLGWQLMHRIDENSLLHGLSAEDLSRTQTEFILTLFGTDETTGQGLQSRHIWPASAVRWQHRYVDLLSVDGEGVSHMDYTHFHTVQPESSVQSPS